MANAKETIKKWFDDLEMVIEKEARFARLINHSSTIGTIREFFIKKMLKSFLPASIEIGSGKIISYTGETSKQIDIVLFDSRFPRFKFVDGVCLYPVEGTIATIEVKSSLTKRSFWEALDNCLSVTQLPIRCQDLEGSIKIQMKKHNVDKKQAQILLRLGMCPKTYIFALKGMSTEKALMQNILAWRTARNNVGNNSETGLPSLIISNRIVGWSKDIGIHLGKNKQTVFMATKAQKKFGFLASHILRVISNKVSTKNAFTNSSYSIFEYNPIDLYLQEYKDYISKNGGLAHLINYP